MANFEIAIAAIVIAVVYFYYCIIMNLKEDMFSSHGGIKVAFIIGLCWILLFPINIAIEYNESNTGPSDVTDNLSWMYRVFIWANIALTSYLVIMLIVALVTRMRGKDERE